MLPEFYARNVSGAEIGEETDGVGVSSAKHKEKSGDAEMSSAQAIMANMPAGDMSHPDVIVVDPPRKGCDPACLDTMLKMQPERIVYVSCDSATLARDLRILCDGGYELKRVRPVDQFGHTVHVETAVLLSKGMVDSRKVKADFFLEDMDLS